MTLTELSEAIAPSHLLEGEQPVSVCLPVPLPSREYLNIFLRDCSRLKNSQFFETPNDPASVNAYVSERLRGYCDQELLEFGRLTLATMDETYKVVKDWLGRSVLTTRDGMLFLCSADVEFPKSVWRSLKALGWFVEEDSECWAHYI